MEFFTLIPLETKIAILVLVILPAIAVIFLRLILHKRLQKINHLISRLLSGSDAEGIQPPIVERLRERYKQASKKLEHVNTIALIDSIYKEERVRFLFFKIECDRAEGITRVLPNLLIAFGLIGTFWGITNNLNSISTAITVSSQNNDAMIGSLQGLKQPLQNMGTAFSASLFGILFGSILTIFNTLLNTSVAKYQLIAGLEDYLDNIYKPTVEGNTRLDTAIDRMVQQQQEFLMRFHENVGSILERSFGRAANQIAEECGRINQIAEDVYTNFSNAAGTISTGATTFQQVADSLQSQNKIFTDSLHEFKSGVDIFQTAANQLEQNNIIQNIDRVLVELNTSQQAFTDSTETLQNSLKGITSSNQIAAQLAHSVYDTWNTSIAQIGAASETIGNGANTFSQAAISLEAQTQTIIGLVPRFQTGVDSFVSGASKVEHNNIIQNIDRVLVELNTSQQAFTDSTQTLQSSLEGITSSNQTAAQLAEKIYQSWHTSIAQIGAASATIDNGAIIFHNAATSLESQTQTLVSLMPELQTGVNDFASAAERVKENNIIKNLDTVVTNLSHTQQAFTDSTQTLKTGVGEIIRDRQRASQFAQQVSHDLEISTEALQKGASNFLTAAEMIRDSKLSVELANASNGWKATQSSLIDLKDILTINVRDRGGEEQQLVEEIKNYLDRLNRSNGDSSRNLVEILTKIDSSVQNNHHNFYALLNNYIDSKRRSNTFRLVK